jgi:site-specific recombinase XerD
MPGAIALAEFDRLRSEYKTLRLGPLNHQPSGVAANERDLNLFSRYFHDRQMEEITGEGTLGFLAWLHQERENRAGSINRKECSIRSYLRFLRFSQVDGADLFPVESLPGARMPYSGPVEVLEPQEVVKLLCSIDRKSVLGFRDFLLYTLLYRLGLRIAEAVGIDIKDIDFEKEVLHIHGKGRRDRKLPLLAEIVELIRTWLIYRRNLCGADLLDALFISKKGNRLSIRAAQDNLQKLVARAGPFSIDKVTPHALRHAFATHAIEGEQDIVVLKAIMGHACMSSTEIYLHPSLKTLKKAMNGHLASRILAGLIKDRRIPVRIHPMRDTS